MCFMGPEASCAWSLEACTDAQAQLFLQWASRNRDDIALSATAQLPGNGGSLVSCHNHCFESSDGWTYTRFESQYGLFVWQQFDA
jgi:hypothetical protein